MSEPTTATPDPRDAQIAELQAQLAAANANAGDTTTTASAAPVETPPAPVTAAPLPTPEAVAVGDVLRVVPEDTDPPDAAPRLVLVVREVEGTADREAGALVVSLPEARWVPLSALTTD